MHKLALGCVTVLLGPVHARWFVYFNPPKRKGRVMYSGSAWVVSSYNAPRWL